MTLTAKQLPEARWDIFEISDYFDGISDTIGAKFRAAIEKTAAILCEHPELDEICPYDPAGTIRYRTIDDFRNYVIFYRHDETELLVVHVRQGNQDFTDLFC